MKYIILGLALLFPACASGKGGSLSGLFTAKVADTVKVADKVTGIESVKVADKAEISAQAPIGYANQANRASAGRDMKTTSINDTELQKEYITFLKQTMYGAFGVIILLGGILSAILGMAIGGLIWCLKKMVVDEIHDRGGKR